MIVSLEATFGYNFRLIFNQCLSSHSNLELAGVSPIRKDPGFKLNLKHNLAESTKVFFS